MEQFRQCLPGSIDQPCRVQGGFVRPAPGVARRAQGIHHGLLHLRRLAQSGGRVVQVDHGLTTFQAWVSFSAMTYILVTPPTASFSVRP